MASCNHHDSVLGIIRCHRLKNFVWQPCPVNSLFEERLHYPGRFALLILLLFMLSDCTAGHSYSDSRHTYFNSLTAAVTAATNRFNPISISEDREFMGTIFQKGKQFGYTISSGRPGTGASEIHISRALLSDVVAFWHTHGSALTEFQYFSNADSDLVARFHLPLYLADYTGKLKVLRPGVKSTRPIQSNSLLRQAFYTQSAGQFVRDERNRLIRINTKHAD